MNWKERLKQVIWIRSLLKKRWYFSLRRLLLNCVVLDVLVDDRDQLNGAELIYLKSSKDWSTSHIGLVQDPSPVPYWTKYERFLKTNNLSFEYFDIHSSDWMEQAKKFDLIVWRPTCSVAALDEARRKIFILEKQCNKKCFPTFDSVFLYEDKILQSFLLSSKGFPVIPTFISYNYQETIAKIPTMQYPLISKLISGSGSLGVELVKSPLQCRRIVDQIFSLKGRDTYWGYARQKDYVYFQNLIENEGYDLRVIVMGEYVFGYYRQVPKGDYRASGMGLIVKKAIPLEAMQLARRVCQALGEICLSVDLLRDQKGVYHIIELSSFILIDTSDDLHVDGVPGAYVFSSEDQFTFLPGRFWIQELALREFFIRHTVKKESLVADGDLGLYRTEVNRG